MVRDGKMMVRDGGGRYGDDMETGLGWDGDGEGKENGEKCYQYCNSLFKNECQAISWKRSHRNLCSQNEIILRLSSLPRQSFNIFSYLFNFKLGDEKCLPPFKMLKKK